MNEQQAKQSSWATCNTIKTREDTKPYHFVLDKEKKGDQKPPEKAPPAESGENTQKSFDFHFCGAETDGAPWGERGRFSKQTLHDRIEPWLTALF